MKKFRFIAMMIAVSASAGGVGNGGDHIRATYLKLGASIIDYLKNSEAGQRVVIDNSLNLDRLNDTLDIKKVSVSEKQLYDNTGSKVEAIGVPDSVTLSQSDWAEHFEKERDITYLVFHEMLRSAAVNDDNYVISKALNPFPTSLRPTTSIVSAKPVNPNEDLSKVLQLSSLAIGGNGCHFGLGADTYIDFDNARGIVDLRFKHYFTEVNQNAAIDRRSCTLAIPFKLQKNQKLVLTQIDALVDYKLDEGTSMSVSSEFFLAGGSGPKLNKTLAAAKTKLTGRTLARGSQLISSACGASGNLRFNTSLLAKRGQVATASAATDVNRITIYMKVEECP